MRRVAELLLAMAAGSLLVFGLSQLHHRSTATSHAAASRVDPGRFEDEWCARHVGAPACGMTPQQQVHIRERRRETQAFDRRLRECHILISFTRSQARWEHECEAEVRANFQHGNWA